jgi:squalene-hopene/tetraprenyl-beta-curcumene cyclase
MSKRVLGVIALVCAMLCVGLNVGIAGPSSGFDLSLRHEVERSLSQGLSFLAKAQKDDGSWSNYPGVTGLALTAFLEAPHGIRDQYVPCINKGLKYLMINVKPDGGIYPEPEPQMRAYNTSICLMALVAADNPELTESIRKARQYLISLQADEKSGVSKDSSIYGGIGYNKDERSDMSNMQFAIEALRASDRFEAPPDDAQKIKLGDTASAATSAQKDLYWGKAITFLERCQNYKKYNDYTWSTNDGGFVYYPGNSKAGGTTSYGSMTYAGMKSFIHAGLTRDDERVQAALKWIKANYTVDKNPELDRQGLFYYYNVMAKALALYGDSTLTDTTGAVHDWRADLANKLISIQQADGSWVNDNGRWWENNPDLVTAYCLMAMEKMGLK